MKNKIVQLPDHLKRRRKIDIIIVSILIIGMICYILFDLCRWGYGRKRLNTPVEPIFKVSESGEQIRGTDEMVDHIELEVKEFLENSSSKVISTSIENGIWYIIQHRDNFFENDEVMENLMCYGWLLEYGSTDEVAAQMGSQIAFIIKYKYRNWENLSDKYIEEVLETVHYWTNEILENYGLS